MNDLREEKQSTKKALLILFGGRSMPNMLTIIHEKPDLVVAIMSKDIAKRDGEKELLAQSIRNLCKNFDHKISLETAYTVDAFDLDEVYTTCVQVVRDDYPHFYWIFNITAATKIMSLGAYRAATELNSIGKSIRCWYIDTLHAKVVPLVGDGRDNQLFAISLEDYATVYNCQMLPGTPDEINARTVWKIGSRLPDFWSSIPIILMR